MNFNNKSTSFWVSILTAVLAISATAGIEWPQQPDALASGIVNAVTGPTGYVGLIGIIVTAIAGPVWKYIRKPNKITVAQLFGSPNTWIGIGSAIVALLIMFGIAIPSGTSEQVVGAVYARDYSLLLTVVVTNLLNPFVRYLRDRRSNSPSTTPRLGN